MNRHKKEKKFLEHGVIDEAAMLAYLNNELSAEERQQLETLLKDDLFAQEALEGLQANRVVVPQSMSSINKKVRERIGQKEKGAFQLHWTNYAWAAALLGLLIGIGAILITYMGKPDDNIAMNKDGKDETGLFETKEEAKPVESPMVVVSDSIPAITQTTKTDAVVTAPTKENELILANKKESEKENTAGKAKDIPAVVTVTQPVTTGASSISITEKNAESTVAPAAKAPSTENKNAAESRADDSKSDAKKSAYVTTTQKVMRGSVMEREEADKTTVITIDDAMRNFNNGNYKESSEQFDAILQQQPNNADVLYFGGISDYINGNARKSEKSFDKLLKEGTKFIDGSKWYKANILLQKGKRDEAKKLLDELSQSNGSYKERAIKKKADAGL